MSQLVFNPSMDGIVQNDGLYSVKTLATRRAEASGAGVSSGILDWSYEGGGNTCYIARMIFMFDTSILGLGAKIKSATFSVAPTTAARNDVNACSIGLVGCNPASTGSLAVGDWSCSTLNSPTELASRFTVASLANNTYKDMALNASGIAAIAKTGFTKLMLRYSLDIDNGTTNAYNDIHIYDRNDATYKPKLTIDYEKSGGAFLENFI
jgi:hypothetical protein